MYQLADKCPISSMESPVPRNLARDFSPTVRRASLCKRIPLPAFSFLVRLFAILGHFPRRWAVVGVIAAVVEGNYPSSSTTDSRPRLVAIGLSTPS